MALDRKIAVFGLGYVGLPVALALATHHRTVLGFDINEQRVRALASGHDKNNEVAPDVLKSTSLRVTSSVKDLAGTGVFVVAVPTPIDGNRQPDLSCLISASEIVGSVLEKGAVVIFESTVYPGVTEEICGPLLARASGLKQGVDFNLGYSPERINPGDKEHTFERVVKVVAADTPEALEVVAALYGPAVKAGLHRAPSIKVAEAAKVIENTQRDLNIALINELALIFDRLGLRTSDVLAAAGTKWNFLPFVPGLVGGHCIGVDPYYLTARAEQAGYHPQVILSGRRINDGMGAFIAQKTVRLLAEAGRPVAGARVGILGLAFKENVPDIRNSRVPDIVRELEQSGINPLIHDPLADAEEARHEYDLALSPLAEFKGLDALILAVPHKSIMAAGGGAALAAMTVPGGVVVDIKSALSSADAAGRVHWSL